MKMTNEEAISILDDLADWFDDPAGHTDNDTRRSKAIRTAIEAMEKSEKYKWHDLRKNPEDLPTEVTVNICVDGKTDNITFEKAIDSGMYFADEKIWTFSTFKELPKGCSVIAWRHIEPFEED